MTIRNIITASAAAASDAEYTLAPDVVLVLLDDGSGRLLDLAGQFYALSPTGAASVVEALLGGEAAAAERVATAFGADPAAVRGDLRRFLSDLERRRLIGPRGRRRRQAGGRLAGLVLRPVLAAANRLPSRSAARAGLLLAAAHGSVRWFGWANTVAAWRRYLGPAPARPVADLGPAARAADEAVRAAAARHVLHLECKERALACWAMLRSEGLPAELVIGIDPFPFATHCWCELGRVILSDFADRCERFTPVVRYA